MSESSAGSVSSSIFALQEGGSAAASEGIGGGHVSDRGTGIAHGSTRGPSALFSYRILKRGLDLFLVLLCSPVLIPLFIVISAAVRISSPGPVFFSHRRLRGHGKFFTMWKFRTMCVNSQEVLEEYLAANPTARLEWHRTHKLKDDPRVTRIGAFLRRSSLDELPQLWNVFLGSMTLVGPRPIVAAEVEKYGPGFIAYCKVKPGITGLWQVSGRSSTSYQRRIELDCAYVDNWSFLGDVVILFKTLGTVVKQHGAY
ncbi:sugar transferase [Granulicella sp. 5B5]|uniref:sugar transferase n=1 Tax=Granulicella sp. 5B5 TaxID=1617967 RepID=UPI0015F51C4C|nr:sugar transferase [Granulicella sp. 5B5]QMV19192.1 sugar transferase [Granulicella sp. 5B5]